MESGRPSATARSGHVAALLLALVAAMLSGAAPASAEDASATVSGRLVEVDGAPVEGFQVLLLVRTESGGWQFAAPRTMSDADGRYTVSDVPPGSYRLWAADPYYPGRLPGRAWPASYTVTEGTTFQVEAGSHLTDLDLTFDSFGEVEVRSTFEGRTAEVTTFLERRVVVGEDVTWLESKNSTGGTIGQVAPGSYRVRQEPARPSEGQVTWAPGVTDPSSATEIRVSAGEVTTVDNVIAPSPRIRVKVTDASGAPVRGARLLASHHGRGLSTFETDAAGEISEAVRPGRYSLEVRGAQGSGLATRPLGQVEITPDRGHDVDVVLYPSGSVRGRILHPSGEPAGFVSIQLDLRVGEEWIRVAALNSVYDAFAFGGLTPGRYRWRIDNPLLESTASGELDLDVGQRLQKDLVVDIPAGLALTIDPGNLGNEVVSRLVTELLSADGTVVETRTGEATATFRVPPGAYRARVRDPLEELATTYLINPNVDDATHFELQGGHESRRTVSPRPLTPLHGAGVPTILDPPVVGRVLGSTRGEWTGTPLDFTDAWLVDGTVVPGATGTTFRVPPEALGRTITKRVTARDDHGGTSTQTSATIGPVRLSNPANIIVEPRLEGVDLQWSSVPHADAYEVRHRVAGSTEWTTRRIEVSMITTWGPSSTAHLRLDTDTAYEVQILATRTGMPTVTGTSVIRSFRTTSAVPAAVTGLSAKARSTTEISASWAHSAGAVRYRVEAFRDGVLRSTAEVSTTSHVVRGLPAGARTTLVVTALNRRGQSVSGAKVVRHTLVARPARPRLTARSTRVLKVAIPRTTGATAYRVEVLRGGKVVKTVTTRSATARVTSLRPRTSYVVTVRALNGDGIATARSAGLKASTR